MWYQKEICLGAKCRGFHLITAEILRQIPEIRKYTVGLAHFYIKHSSASLAINENADIDVRIDMENYFNNLAPENEPYYTHIMEGADDMPAHLKAVIIGTELTIPIANGTLLLGVWQGIYLCEHRNAAGSRHVVVTLNGEINR